MTRTFFHRSKILGLQMRVSFKKGEVPKPSCVIVLYADFSREKAVLKEFNKWLNHVWNTLEDAGAVVKR